MVIYHQNSSNTKPKWRPRESEGRSKLQLTLNIPTWSTAPAASWHRSEECHVPLTSFGHGDNEWKWCFPGRSQPGLFASSMIPMNTSPRSLLVADKMIPHCIETPCNSQTWSKLSKPFWQGPGRTWRTPQEVSMILIPCRWKFHPCPPPVLWLRKCAGRSRWPRLALAGIGVSSTAPHPEFFLSGGGRFFLPL